MGFGVWEGLQWMGNGCGLQMDGFSAHFEPSESISDDFHDFGHFAIFLFYLTRKGSGRASDSNSIPHALSESSGMQTVPYPAIGYPYNLTKADI